MPSIQRIGIVLQSLLLLGVGFCPISVVHAGNVDSMEHEQMMIGTRVAAAPMPCCITHPSPQTPIRTLFVTPQNDALSVAADVPAFVSIFRNDVRATSFETSGRSPPQKFSQRSTIRRE